MSASDAFARAREQLARGRELDAKLLLAAGISDLAQEAGIRVVVSGGTSVDLHVAGTLEESPSWPRGWEPSEDLDLLNLDVDSVGASVELRRILHDHGFLPGRGEAGPLGVDHERGWRHPDVPIAVEIIGGPFEGSRDHLVVVEVDGGEVHVRGPEDTLLEHLDWAYHTGDQRSWTRALAIARAQEERLDREYLERKAAARDLGDALARCLSGEPLDR